ncbi:MAG: translesion error-prone DNA polymerase V autoproteolytic subunit [Bdellovibrionaceae bacterium]|nr:translesion error-prone DNA polymerase V autoproteolytic subunit [Pseudobdellovibrionaceae bacterium]
MLPALSLLKRHLRPLRLPLFSSPASCGFPSPADEYIDTALDLNEHLIAHPAATFFVRAKGDSMIGAGIFEGDILIIDRSLTAQSGNIVLAVIDGEFTLKRFTRSQSEIWLHAENEKYPPVKITEDMDFTIWGVAIHCIHKLR